ncbi:hypothetical protein ACFFG5_21355 [Paraburkholderia humisilvae]
MPIHEGAVSVPEVRPAEGAGMHSPVSAHAQGAKAPEGAALPAAGRGLRPPSSAPQPSWPGAGPLAAIPSEYRSSDVPGVFVDQNTGGHFIIKDGKAYRVVDAPNVRPRGSIGLKGGGDTDPSAQRRQLGQRKTEIEQKAAELSGVKTSLERSIEEERRKKHDAQQAVSTRETGKRLAEQWLEDLKRKQQEGEANLQPTIDTQTTEVRGWETELQRAQREVDRYQQSLTQLESTLRTLTSDLERAERERVAVDQQLQRL